VQAASAASAAVAALARAAIPIAPKPIGISSYSIQSYSTTPLAVLSARTASRKHVLALYLTSECKNDARLERGG